MEVFPTTNLLAVKNRAEAERKVMEWIVTGNIPVRVNSKDSKVQSIEKIRLFNDLRTVDFDTEDIETIIKILKERNYLYSAVPKSSKGSIPIEDFLENFWDFEKSPYVREKLGKKQSIHRQYCATLISRTRLYWIPRLARKCVGEITNDMRANGFDKSRPIIVTEAYIIVDGHSRFMAGVQLWTPVKRTSQDFKCSVS